MIIAPSFGRADSANKPQITLDPAAETNRKIDNAMTKCHFHALTDQHRLNPTKTLLDRNPVGQEPREEKRVVESASINAGSLLFLATLDYPVKYCFNEHDTLRQRHHL